MVIQCHISYSGESMTPSSALMTTGHRSHHLTRLAADDCHQWGWSIADPRRVKTMTMPGCPCDCLCTTSTAAYKHELNTMQKPVWEALFETANVNGNNNRCTQKYDQQSARTAESLRNRWVETLHSVHILTCFSAYTCRFTLTEEDEQRGPVLGGGHAVFAPHEDAAEFARTRSVLASHHVDAIRVRRRGFPGEPLLCKTRERPVRYL